ncbi:hypothetical protein M1N43_00045 [Thermodesulfovibrionales bacterium]|nr:hypothetical protein [Thermodesulfovibrionales bacterium]
MKSHRGKIVLEISFFYEESFFISVLSQIPGVQNRYANHLFIGIMVNKILFHNTING